ncbi:MAG: alanine racemase [Waddliaceae bacterium]|nr:alanine racemase [Waddliaceae bacterium]
MSVSELIIDRASIRRNILSFKEHSKLPLIAMIKGNGYGTDLYELAYTATKEGIDVLGVAYLSEALYLQKHAIDARIFIIHPSLQDHEELVYHGFECQVGSLQEIQSLELAGQSQSRKAKVHLNVNTGIGRFGSTPNEALELAIYIDKSPFLHLIGLMTHPASAESPEDDEYTQKQFDQYQLVLKQMQKKNIFPPMLHCENTAASTRHSPSASTHIRVGLGLLGISPSKECAKDLPLDLALTLRSQIIHITSHQKGEYVGYGKSYQIQRDKTRIASVALGYHDGLHRLYSNRGKVWVNGQFAPLVANICMDMCMVDISDIPTAKLGSSVLFFGKEEGKLIQDPCDFAESGHTIAHELISCIGPRVKRVWI